MFWTAVLLGFLLPVGPQGDAPPQRIVAASNVRLRSAPQTSAGELARLPLGAIVGELEASPDKDWFRVLSPEGKTGWVFGSLTAPYTDREAVGVYKRVIQARLKIEEPGFPDAVDLFDFVSRVASRVQGPARAEFDLFGLRALDRSLRQIMGDEPTNAIHRDWIRKHEADLAYSEPAGQWLVQAKLYWELEEKHRGNPIAEQIAWEGASTGVPGECEGYIPCSLAVSLMTSGRYLDLYPAGSHATEAIERIDFPLKEILKPNTPYTMDPRENNELRESLSELSRIIDRTSSPQKAPVLSRLKRIAETFLIPGR